MAGGTEKGMMLPWPKPGCQARAGKACLVGTGRELRGPAAGA